MNILAEIEFILDRLLNKSEIKRIRSRTKLGFANPFDIIVSLKLKA